MTARGLLLDYGGVLTPSVGRMFRAFERAVHLPRGTVFDAMARAYGEGGQDSDIARLERGELDVARFEDRLASELSRGGHEVAPDGLVERLFSGLRPAGRLWDAAQRARAAGVRTALLSNSWGTDGYPQELLDATFDVVVISAAVGMRKPDAAIFHHAADALEVDLRACVFVDDLERNVRAAEQLGITGIHHGGDEDAVLAALSAHLPVDVREAVALT